MHLTVRHITWGDSESAFKNMSNERKFALTSARFCVYAKCIWLDENVNDKVNYMSRFRKISNFECTVMSISSLKAKQSAAIKYFYTIRLHICIPDTLSSRARLA